ncbi:MAG: hypothetical protein IJT00_01935 [Lachnospiraceae bacterium]|nr:hypothetical protein [Lachnospiraceae bacterium]
MKSVKTKTTLIIGLVIIALTALTGCGVNSCKVKVAGKSFNADAEEVYIEETRLSAEDMEKLATLQNMKALKLHRCEIIDYSALAAAPALEELELFKTEVSDLSSMSGLIKLKTLDINTAGFTDLTPVSRMTWLKELSLSDTTVNEQLQCLSGLTGLESLSLDRMKIKEAYHQRILR